MKKFSVRTAGQLVCFKTYKFASLTGSPSDKSVRSFLSLRLYLAALNIQVARSSALVLPGEVYISQPVALCHLPSEAAALT
jgi:hypothetical protein